jgi:hypothetical protein
MSALTRPGALASCVVVFVFAACAPAARRVVPMPFESEQWRDNPVIESDTRERMAADLVRSQSLKGLSRSEVIAKLGEADITDGKPLQPLRYDIREDYGYDIDPRGGAYLVVEFGPHDIVNRVRTEEWRLPG